MGTELKWMDEWLEYELYFYNHLESTDCPAAESFFLPIEFIPFTHWSELGRPKLGQFLVNGVSKGTELWVHAGPQTKHSISAEGDGKKIAGLCYMECKRTQSRANQTTKYFYLIFFLSSFSLSKESLKVCIKINKILKVRKILWFKPEVRPDPYLTQGHETNERFVFGLWAVSHTSEVNITFPLPGESPFPKVLVTTKRSVSFSRSQILYSSMHRIWKE